MIFVVVSIGAIDVLFLFVLMIFKYQNKKNTRCLIIIIFSSFTFYIKNNIILQIDTTLNNEASVLQSFFQIFGGMTPRYFSRKSAISKIIN
jgi:NADH:ubiquinone oxidoreductase subunit 6 (subunit J)